MQAHLVAQFRSRFGRDPEWVARAPGRIELIGNHTDYNGGPVLGVAIDRAVWVAAARRPDGCWRLASEGHPDVEEAAGAPFVGLAGAAAWANYPRGVLAALAEAGVATPGGFDLLVASDLPAGAGLASSAALELAAGLVFAALAGVTLARDELVRLALRAENTFVGVPCGILDQAVAGFGQPGHAVRVDPRAETCTPVPLPPDARFWIFHPHERHALVDGLYAARHRECREAARLLGAACLADVPPARLEEAAARLDPVCRRRARHVVGEIARVAACEAALRAGDLAAAGRLLTASHASSRDLFENSTPALDALAARLAAAPGVRGARLTGGGFGGAVLALAGPEFGDAAAARVAAEEGAARGRRPEVIPVRPGEAARLLTP